MDELTFTQAMVGWLNSESSDNQRDSNLILFNSFNFIADSTMTGLI